MWEMHLGRLLSFLSPPPLTPNLLLLLLTPFSQNTHRRNGFGAFLDVICHPAPLFLTSRQRTNKQQ